MSLQNLAPLLLNNNYKAALDEVKRGETEDELEESDAEPEEEDMLRG